MQRVCTFEYLQKSELYNQARASKYLEVIQLVFSIHALTPRAGARPALRPGGIAGGGAALSRAPVSSWVPPALACVCGAQSRTPAANEATEHK